MQVQKSGLARSKLFGTAAAQCDLAEQTATAKQADLAEQAEVAEQAATEDGAEEK